jgi:CheY-like chemotaxis protein
MKILYIEDQAPNIELIVKILNNEGHEVIYAMNGTKGISSALEHHPDFILLDIELPDMMGYEVATRIKEHLDVPIVALTGTTGFGDREKTIEAGCDGYLPKPISRKNLLRVLAEFTKSNP